MEVFIHSIVTVSPRKIVGKNCAEIHFTGTTLHFPFTPPQENSGLSSMHAVPIKEIKKEIHLLKKTVKTIIFRGGEPLVQNQGLALLTQTAKECGMFTNLETYGTKPVALEGLFKRNLVDIVTLKLYIPLRESWFSKLRKGTLLQSHKETITNIKKSIALMSKQRVKVYVRIMVVPGFLYKVQDIAAIIHTVKDIPHCTIELVSYVGHSDQSIGIKQPSGEFMDDIHQALKEKFPNNHITVVQNIL
ncbi:MAG: hypothetical protein ACMXYE_00850 [Candidatus Woesearchaeota archaeon]